MIELPEGVAPGESRVPKFTSIPDVWRHYQIPSAAEVVEEQETQERPSSTASLT